MKATIKTVFTLTPQRISFTAYENAGGHQEVTVKQTDGNPFKLLSVTSTHDFIEVTTEPAFGTTVPGDATYKLFLEVKPDAPVGNHSGNLVFKTDFKEMPELKVTYFIRMNALVTAIPNQVRMSVRTKPYQAKVLTDSVNIYKEPDTGLETLHTSLKGTTLNVREVKDEWFKIWIPGVGEGWVKQAGLEPIYPGSTYAVTVNKHQGKDFKVIEISTDVSSLETELKTIRNGASFQVLMKYRGEVKEGLKSKGTLTIKTNDAEYPVMTIPVNITVMDRAIKPPAPPRKNKINTAGKRKAPGQLKSIDLKKVEKKSGEK